MRSMTTGRVALYCLIGLAVIFCMGGALYSMGKADAYAACSRLIETN